MSVPDPEDNISRSSVKVNALICDSLNAFNTLTKIDNLFSKRKIICSHFWCNLSIIEVQKVFKKLYFLQTLIERPSDDKGKYANTWNIYTGKESLYTHKYVCVYIYI